MDLVLINSPDSFDTPIHYEDEPRVPLGLMSIAAWVEQCGYTVAIYDCWAHQYSHTRILSQLERDKPRVVGINCYAANSACVYGLCDAIRAALPQIKLVLGGPHPSCDPAHVFASCGSVDLVILGQGEAPFADLLAHPEAGSALCVSRDEIGTDKPLSPQPLPVPFDALPMPAYHLIDMERYLACDDQAYIASSRGCYFNCAFCCSKNVFAGCTAYRAPARVLEEVDYLHTHYGVTKFYFYDDNILRWEGLAAFGREMHARGFTWTAQATAIDITPERVTALRESGCTRLSIGLESGAPSLQAYIGKRLPADLSTRIGWLAAAGIGVRGYFMVGLPDETMTEVLATANMICDLARAGLTDLCIFAVRPYPGTRLYRDCVARFGAEGLDGYQYLDDYQAEDDPFVRAKLKTYNTIGTKSVCPAFSPRQIRGLVRGLYHLFLDPPATETARLAVLQQYLKEATHG